MHDVLIVGAGPTGICCAIAAQKAGLSYLILEKGVLVNSIYQFPTNMTFFSTSKNLEVGDVPFISHVDKPTRKEALEYYRRLVEFHQINIQYQSEVLSLNQEDDIHIIKTTNSSFQAKNVILATGFYDHPNLLNVPGESLPKVKHYFDDAHPYIGMDIAIVGAANSACDVALETWQKGAKVTMIIRGKGLYEKVKYWIKPNIENRIKEGSIKAYFESNIVEITKDKIKLRSPDGLIELKNDFVLAMTGYQPNYRFLESLGIDFDSSKDKIPNFDPVSLESNVSGVFLAGVLLGGRATSTYFIENSRDHGEKIIRAILKK